jgi:hypothetical protein
LLYTNGIIKSKRSITSSGFHSYYQKGFDDLYKRILQGFNKGIVKGHVLISKMMDLQVEASKTWIFFINQRTSILVVSQMEFNMDDAMLDSIWQG